MIKFILGINLFLILGNTCSYSQIPIIIDTDGGIDDLRAFSMIYSSDTFSVKAILTNDGALSPSQTADKIKNFFSYININEPYIGVGNKILPVPPPWRKMSSELIWGDTISTMVSLDFSANTMLNMTLSSCDKVYYLAMGPLTNLANHIKQAWAFNFEEQIHEIIWYNPGIHPETGVYYANDSLAFHTITRDYKIPISCIHVGSDSLYFITKQWLQSLPTTKYASIIQKSHTHPLVQSKLDDQHFQFWDELMLVYLVNPDLFEKTPNPLNPYLFNIEPREDKNTEKHIYDILRLFLN